MSAVLTRRGLVQAAGVTLAAGVAGLPAAASTSPDAGLLDLIARHGAIVAARNAHADVHEAAERRFREVTPPRPEALWNRGDIGFHLCTGATGRDVHSSGHVGSFYCPGDVEKLRAGPPVTRWAIVGDDVDPPPREPDSKGEARRQEIIAASDAWEEEKRVVADRVGMTAAEARDDRLYAAVWEARDAIRVLCPTTLAGLRAKSRWIMNIDDPEEEAVALVEQVSAFGGVAS